MSATFQTGARVWKVHIGEIAEPRKMFWYQLPSGSFGASRHQNYHGELISENLQNCILVLPA